MLFGCAHDDLMRRFQAAHLHPWNRRLHLIGIPTLVASALLWAAALVVPDLWVWPAVLMPLGFACQFLGHAIEGNRPEVFTDWRFLPIGLEWWWLLVTGRG
jgi:hypothetical protein